MVKIKTYRIGKRGLRGLTVTIPKIWAHDVDAKPGDLLEFFRDEQNRIIIYPPVRVE